MTRASVFLLTIASCCLPYAAHAGPTNVILFIGDGMGAEAIAAGRYLLNGDAAPLFFETLPRSGWLTHASDGGLVTDSAASGTAIATGHKVTNGVVSVELPGSGAELPTVLENLQAQGKRAGLVTLGTSITDATPATFAAHTPSRANHAEIANDYLTQSRPSVLFGQLRSDLPSLPADAAAAGYLVATTPAEFNDLDPTAGTHYAGLFSPGQEPSLAAMTVKALAILTHDSPNGFFALVENENTDSGGHNNNISQVANGVLNLNAAVEAAYQWAVSAGVLDDTLILVTADHETGGLTATNSGAGNLPGATWTTESHTQTPVPIFARGPNSGYVAGYLDNTELSNVMQTDVPPPRTITRAFQQGVGGYGGTLDTHVRQDDSDVSFADASPLVVDLDDDAASGNQPSQALIRFAGLFGTGDDQIPAGATIVSAALVLRTSATETDGSRQAATIHRMLADWEESSTWNSVADGIAVDDVEAAAAEDGRLVSGTRDATVAFDVTETVQAWAGGGTNFGWAVMPTSSDDWRFLSSESAVVGLRPMLSVTFAVELAGDYNFNGVVDAADYTTWRDTLGETGPNLAADGNDDLEVNQADYAVWKMNFGTASASAGASFTVPEPVACATLLWLSLPALVGRVPRRDARAAARFFREFTPPWRKIFTVRLRSGMIRSEKLSVPTR